MTQQFFRNEDIQGKTVVEATGKTLGKAIQISFSLDGKMALVVETAENKETQVPMGRIMGVADYVILRPDTGSEAMSPPSQQSKVLVMEDEKPQQMGVENEEVQIQNRPKPMGSTQGTAREQTVCPQCGNSLRVGVKFCTRCGARLA